MRVAIRADASNYMGTGHIVRCLTLANSLRDNNNEVEFICRDHPGNLISTIKKQNFEVRTLPSLNNEISVKPNYTGWLGETPENDAQQTIDVIDELNPDWLVIDHYEIDEKWEKKVRPYCKNIMVIDDLANRKHDCDMLLDQNFYFDYEEPYKELLPAKCKQLIGPEYVLLKPEYALYRNKKKSHNEQIKKILLFFGGSDNSNMTSSALKALSLPEFQQIKLDVVVGINNRKKQEIFKLAEKRLNTVLYTKPLDHLAELMFKADFSIGGGGATTWERMCMGLPSLVIALAENQFPLSKKLAERNYIRFIGYAKEISTNDISNALRQEILSKEYKERAILGSNLCDGNGVNKIVKTLSQYA
jgi:UDP-2,4-diacetamido-2,4,6-trideoxy-beta-L-altropyranose hydrolase